MLPQQPLRVRVSHRREREVGRHLPDPRFDRGVEPATRLPQLHPVFVDHGFVDRVLRQLQQLARERAKRPAFLRREALQPHAIAPEDMVQRTVDGPEKSTAIAPALRIRKLLARAIQTVVEPPVVAREEAESREKGVGAVVHAQFCLCTKASQVWRLLLSRKLPSCPRDRIDNVSPGICLPLT